MRIKMDCVGIPADYAIKEVGITLDYTPTKIGDSEYVLPFHFELNSKDTMAVVKNDADYRSTGSSGPNRPSPLAMPSRSRTIS